MTTPTYHRGFTLLEVLIVIALGILLVALMLPIGVNYYRSQVADETAAGLTSAFSRASTESRLGKHNSAFGIRLFPDHYVFFEGSSYATRNSSFDETYTLPSGATLTSPAAEFVFAQLTGVPNATGTISLTQFGKTLFVIVADSGMITKN